MLFLLTSVSVYHVETLYTILNPEGSLLWDVDIVVVMCPIPNVVVVWR